MRLSSTKDDCHKLMFVLRYLQIFWAIFAIEKGIVSSWVSFPVQLFSVECHSNGGDVVQISFLNHVEIQINTDINI